MLLHWLKIACSCLSITRVIWGGWYSSFSFALAIRGPPFMTGCELSGKNWQRQLSYQPLATMTIFQVLRFEFG